MAVVGLGKLGRSHSCFQLEPGRCWGRQTFRLSSEQQCSIEWWTCLFQVHRRGGLHGAKSWARVPS